MQHGFTPLFTPPKWGTRSLNSLALMVGPPMCLEGCRRTGPTKPEGRSGHVEASKASLQWLLSQRTYQPVEQHE